ncbi:MAG: glycosyltransferase [Phycisphaerales bacterium JB063]
MPDRPVIAHVLHRLDFAGAEVLAAQIARGMRERYRFVFMVLDGVGPLGDRLRDDGFEVLELHRRPGVDRQAMRAMREALRTHDVGLLHAHQYTPFFYASAGRGLALRRRVPILFTEHGRHTPDRRSTKRVLANKLLLAKGDRVTAVSGFIRQALIDNEAIPADRVQTLYNGIDPGPTRSAQERVADRVAARAALGLEMEVPIVVQAARFHPVKDHATALRAWQQVHAELPEARLVLLGDGPLRDELEALAHELGIEEAVHFMGQVPDVRALLPGADVAMLSSLSEGLSVTLLEAMAAGLPIVATAVGGNPELVADEATGLLAPRGDAERLASHLLALLGDATRRAALGKAGRSRLLQRFTAEQMHAGYARYYEALLGR